MYDRWSLNYQARMEVNLSLSDLAAASAKTNNEAIQKRLAELKAYIHYIKLFYAYQDNASVANYTSLLNYLHEVHSLRLMQTWALQAYYIKPPKNYSKPSPRSAKTTSRRGTDVYDVVARNFSADRAEHASVYSLSSLKVAPAKAQAIQKNGNTEALFITGPNRYEFSLTRSTSISVKAGNTIESKVTVLDRNDNIVYEKVIKPSAKGYDELSIKLPAGNYALLAGTLGGFGRLVFPNDIVFLSTGMLYYDNGRFPLVYIYVPQDAKEIIYEDSYGPGTNKRGYWQDPDGKTIKPQKVSGTIYKVPVGPGQAGKTWALNIGHRAFSVLNIPNRFSLQKFEYREN